MRSLRTVNIIGIIITLFLSTSCSNSETPVGEWEDNIKLSRKVVELSPDANAVVITTEGKWWWIDHIALNGELHSTQDEVDTSQPDFIIQKEEFKIERRNSTEIHIEMTQNQASSKRVLFIGLQAGNYFDGIKIVQAAQTND